MDKAIKKHLTDFENAGYRKAYAGSLHPIDAELVKIGFSETKHQLYAAIEDLEIRLDNALQDLEDMEQYGRF
jgi:hypothetical protein